VNEDNEDEDLRTLDMTINVGNSVNVMLSDSVVVADELELGIDDGNIVDGMASGVCSSSEARLLNTLDVIKSSKILTMKLSKEITRRNSKRISGNLKQVKLKKVKIEKLD